MAKKLNIDLSPFAAALLIGLPIACSLPPVKTFEKLPDSPPAQGRGNQAADTASQSPSTDSNSRHWIQINSNYDTYLKIDKVDSSLLSNEEKCLLPRGTRHNLAAQPEWTGSYAKITLENLMVGCSFKTGYVYEPHIGSFSNSESSPRPSNNVYSVQTTLYTTENNSMEGGSKDRCGRPLHTLDDYMNWDANEVSVAMDKYALPYGTIIRIPEIEKRLKVKDPIPFKVVDTGGAFYNQGTSRMDICVGHSQSTIYSSKYSWISHGKFEFEVISLGKSIDCH